ncbi:MAG: sensor histidine kinase [Bacteroidota bacterium]
MNKKVTPSEDIKRQAEYFSARTPFNEMLNVLEEYVLVLNNERRAVFANRSITDELGDNPPESIYGMRPGDIFECIHATETAEGCGCSEFCRFCGGFQAIESGLNGISASKEYRITRSGIHNSLDLKVNATPVKTMDEDFIVFAITDVSHEKRRMTLERVFFHDVMNTLTGLMTTVDLLNFDQKNSAGYLARLNTLTDRLADEITAQKELSDAEHNELILRPVEFDSIEFLNELIGNYTNYQISKDKTIQIYPGAAAVNIFSDITVLRRIIGNMIKNALEATAPGGTVLLNCIRREAGIEFSIQNPGVIEEDIQKQIFQKSFSTKGVNRGLGTYSMKLLGERYMNGKVSFTSTETEGTIFIFRLPIHQ